MSISDDHLCRPDCPCCIARKDFLKSLKKGKKELSMYVKTRKVVAKGLVFIPLLFLVALVIHDLGGQSHVTAGLVTGGLNCRQSSIGLAEKLERIETLLTDIRLSQTEEVHFVAAKEVVSSEIDHPGSGISPDSPPQPASSSNREKKLDFPAEFLLGLFVCQLCLVFALMIVWKSDLLNDLATL